MPNPTNSAADDAADSAERDLAARLLDAQVRFHLDRLSGEQQAVTVARLAESLLTASQSHQVADLVDAATLRTIVVRALAVVPASAAVSGFVELAVTTAYDGPGEPFPLGEVVDRAQVEVLLDRVLALTPALERGLDRLTESPLVGTVASRFMGRVVGEVVQANQAVADRVPGLGSLMSFGTSAASKMMGAADKQLEGLLGDTVGKGGTFAVRRLNRIVLETLRDPTTREAVLQVWDLAAREPVASVAGKISRAEVDGVVDAVHDLAVSALAGERVAQLVGVVVDGFFERFGGYTPLELLDELDLDRADLVADLVRLAPGVLEALRESGDLERMVRAELEPFYASAEVRDLLGGADGPA